MDPGPFLAAASNSTGDEELWTSLEVMSASFCTDAMSPGVMLGCCASLIQLPPRVDMP